MTLHPRAVLFENCKWLVVDKPAGISTHGAYAGDVALQEWMELHWNQKTFVCSRLDKGTSGVIIFAKTPEASAEAEHIHENEASEKTYLFLSHAKAQEEAFSVQKEVDEKPSSTRFRMLQKVGQNFLYEARITRGRKHQIRRHSAYAGIPVLGDNEYGGSPAERLFLHCHKTRWPGISEDLISPIPKSFLEQNPARRAVFSALERRGSLLESVTNAFRCVHRGEVQHDCAMDSYGSHLCVWDYESQLSETDVVARLTPITDVICEELGLKGWVLKRSVRNPHTRKLVSSQLVFGEAPPALFTVREHNVLFQVSLTESQHVGLFLDQRDNRRLVWKESEGARVANLFSYTCSFSVMAAAGKAEVVFSVDAAKKYLECGVSNFEVNTLGALRVGKFVCEDVRSWLMRQERKMEREGNSALFDIIVCDPPTYSSTTSKGEFSVSEEWDFLAQKCSALLKPGGRVFFSTNHRAGERSLYEKVLKQNFAVVERRSQPIDFPALPGEPEHVKLFLCYKTT
jgi:23S rRNA G2069 N7-methylase RlmK/C1962 C5-methylase RlmI